MRQTYLTKMIFCIALTFINQLMRNNQLLADLNLVIADGV